MSELAMTSCLWSWLTTADSSAVKNIIFFLFKLIGNVATLKCIIIASNEIPVFRPLRKGEGFQWQMDRILQNNFKPWTQSQFETWTQSGVSTGHCPQICQSCLWNGKSRVILLFWNGVPKNLPKTLWRNIRAEFSQEIGAGNQKRLVTYLLSDISLVHQIHTHAESLRPPGTALVTCARIYNRTGNKDYMFVCLLTYVNRFCFLSFVSALCLQEFRLPHHKSQRRKRRRWLPSHLRCRDRTCSVSALHGLLAPVQSSPPAVYLATAHL